MVSKPYGCSSDGEPTTRYTLAFNTIQKAVSWVIRILCFFQHCSKYSIDDSIHEPVYVKNYRLPQSQKTEIKNQVQKLLDGDLIELSTSNYNSPLIIVPKKSTEG